jgi:hypothetical protein
MIPALQPYGSSADFFSVPELSLSLGLGVNNSGDNGDNATDIIDVPGINNGDDVDVNDVDVSDVIVQGISDSGTNNGSLANENRSFSFADDTFDNSYNFFDDLMDVAPTDTLDDSQLNMS